jgi:RNA polymerase sigma-70 factor (TIGR02960 family)
VLSHTCTDTAVPQNGTVPAFEELIEAYQHELRLHCYRMLGSLSDADDVLQESLIAAWRGLPSYEGRASLRTWLYRIATNHCLNYLRDAGRRPTPEPVPPFDPPEPTRRAEVTWLQPYPTEPAAAAESRETVELAFIVALQHLPPRQTAVLVLRDVLGFSMQEISMMLGTQETAVKGLLQRARAGLPAVAAEPAPAPGSTPERELTRRFAEAFTTDDIDTLVSLLTDDAWLAMPPAPHEYHGRGSIATFLHASAAGRGNRTIQLLPTRANSQPAFGCYYGPNAAGLIVLTLAAERIRAITRFLDTGLPTRFGLPDRLPATAVSTPTRGWYPRRR